MAQPYNDEAFWRFWHHIHPVFNRTRQGPPPVNVVNYFTIIANSPRPLTLTLAIYLEDLGKRSPQSGQRQKDRSGYKVAQTTNSEPKHSPKLKHTSN